MNKIEGCGKKFRRLKPTKKTVICGKTILDEKVWFCSDCSINKSNHVCPYFNTSNMIDVLVRNGFVHCRRCGYQLEPEQIEPMILKAINEKLELKKKRRT